MCVGPAGGSGRGDYGVCALCPLSFALRPRTSTLDPSHATLCTVAVLYPLSS
eukprot:SAG11_NODE_19727_length_460_cov_0.775623_1_plen_51_part_01